MKWAIEEYGEFLILFLVCCSVITFFMGLLTEAPELLNEAYYTDDQTGFLGFILQIFL